MPLPADPCGVPLDAVCCTSLFDVAEDILAVAFDAVADCIDNDLCAAMSHFVSVNEPSFANGDYVAVWLVTSEPAPGVFSRTGRRDLMPRPRATYGIKLVETGWPTLRSTEGAMLIPAPDDMHAASRHSYAHAELMMRRVYDTFRARENPARKCGFQSIGTLTPTERNSGLAGWRFSLTLDIDF